MLIPRQTSDVNTWILFSILATTPTERHQRFLAEALDIETIRDIRCEYLDRHQMLIPRETSDVNTQTDIRCKYLDRHQMTIPGQTSDVNTWIDIRCQYLDRRQMSILRQTSDVNTWILLSILTTTPTASVGQPFSTTLFPVSGRNNLNFTKIMKIVQNVQIYLSVFFPKYCTCFLCNAVTYEMWISNLHQNIVHAVGMQVPVKQSSFRMSSLLKEERDIFVLPNIPSFQIFQNALILECPVEPSVSVW